MKQAVALFLLALIAVQPAASHVADDERIALERIQQYLRDIDRLVIAAEKSRHVDSRFPLDYDALRADLNTIHQALDRHLRAPQRAPKSLPPLLLQEHLEVSR